MIAYGRKKLHTNLLDCHPRKSYYNWWELEFTLINKKVERQRIKKELKEYNDN